MRRPTSKKPTTNQGEARGGPKASDEVDSDKDEPLAHRAELMGRRAARQQSQVRQGQGAYSVTRLKCRCQADLLVPDPQGCEGPSPTATDLHRHCSHRIRTEPQEPFF